MHPPTARLRNGTLHKRVLSKKEKEMVDALKGERNSTPHSTANQAPTARRGLCSGNRGVEARERAVSALQERGGAVAELRAQAEGAGG